MAISSRKARKLALAVLFNIPDPSKVLQGKTTGKKKRVYVTRTGRFLDYIIDSKDKVTEAQLARIQEIARTYDLCAHCGERNELQVVPGICNCGR